MAATMSDTRGFMLFGKGAAIGLLASRMFALWHLSPSLPHNKSRPLKDAKLGVASNATFPELAR